MSHSLNVAVVGLGRIGVFHARHVQELALENNCCRLAAVVDCNMERTKRFIHQYGVGSEIQCFESAEELAQSGTVQAAVIASPAKNHQYDAQTLVGAGMKVLLEKPITGSAEAAREFTSFLNQHHRHSLMLAFQRRFDKPLLHAKKILEKGAIGKPIKIISVLEDSSPPPPGYESPGLLADMSVHNIDEVIWLTGARPRSVQSFCSRLHNFKITPVEEDFDDGIIHLWFDDDLAAQIQVSRNHIPGYRVETHIYGERGTIHVGRFQENRFDVHVEAYHHLELVDSRLFTMRDYAQEIPEFIGRFGPAYKAELAHFLECCRQDKPFSVNQNDGLVTMEIAAGATRSTITAENSRRIKYTIPG